MPWGTRQAIVINRVRVGDMSKQRAESGSTAAATALSLCLPASPGNEPYERRRAWSPIAPCHGMLHPPSLSWVPLYELPRKMQCLGGPLRLSCAEARERLWPALKRAPGSSRVDVSVWTLWVVGRWPSSHRTLGGKPKPVTAHGCDGRRVSST
ncbi:hypothetical protein K490DRAFT_68373 [Saccharata proteae CBS 121410]|uniref:Uncharacterized protein n=1 Tax=Saccharata proteae CBS 121410 TaxID=1314787 RepID=A0A9P4HPY2_9PEZI|nr:hypothetical protein K490DRAFT_68373 [Saccharata proteae CBS 121410]